MHTTEYIKSIINICEIDKEHSCIIFSDVLYNSDYSNVDLYLKTLHDCNYIEYSLRGRPLEFRYFKVIERIPEKLTISRLVKNKNLYIRKRKLETLNKNIENE